VKILLVQNSHRSGSSSGDDGVYEREAALLQRYGHEVSRYNPSNDDFDSQGLPGKLSVALQIPWSFSSARRIREIVRIEKPDIAHVHNFFPLISPSVYYALKAAGVPLVQTLHDFRFLCAMAFFMRDGRICEECRGGSVFRSIRYGCFKESRMQTIPVALMLKLHQKLNTFKEKIDAYICLTESQRKIFSDSGFAEEKLYVKPNFVEDTYEPGGNGRGEYVVFIGRLGEEKGLRTLIAAWRALPEVPLKIIGDGPDAEACKKLVGSLKIQNIEFLGFKPHQDCMKILDGSRFLVMPSICYETFGMVIVEAFSRAKPVIASNLGAMADIVKDNETGLLYTAGGAGQLADKVRQLWNSPGDCAGMGMTARKEYQAKYTPEKNYEMLMNIYDTVIERKRGQKR
jgi:glycosyltransferase involved in cell wall biosynthesis